MCNTSFLQPFTDRAQATLCRAGPSLCVGTGDPPPVTTAASPSRNVPFVVPSLGRVLHEDEHTIRPKCRNHTYRGINSFLTSRQKLIEDFH